jgi:hypothetical protein
MIWVVLLFAAIFYFSIRPMFKQKQRRDLIWVGIIFAVTLTMCVLVVAGVHLPSSSMMLADLMKSIGLHYPPLE